MEASFSNFESSKRLFRSAKLLSESSGVEFDWFIRTRPDMLWLENMPAEFLDVLEPTNLILYDGSWPGGVADYFYIVHKSAAEKLWGEGSDIFLRIPCGSTEGLLINPEALLKLTFTDVVGANVEQFNPRFDFLLTFARAHEITCERPFAVDLSPEQKENCQVSQEIYVNETNAWIKTR